MPEPRSPLLVAIDAEDNGVKVAVSGELDFREYGRLIHEVTAQISPAAGATVLTLDLGGVTYCDSAGLGALMQIRRTCDTAGWTLTLNGIGPAVRPLLDMTGLSDWFGPART